MFESSSPLLVCPQWPPDLQGLKPDGADSIAARGKENPKSTDSALSRAVEAEVGAAVTSSDVLIQVLLMLFTRVLNCGLLPDSQHHCLGLAR